MYGKEALFIFILAALCCQNLKALEPAAVKLFEEGRELAGAKQYARAAVRFLGAISIDPHPVFYTELGHCYRSLQKHDKAYQAFSKAFELDKKDSASAVLAVQEAIDACCFDKAKSIIRRLYKLAPETARVLHEHFLLKGADHAFKCKLYRKAYRRYTKADELFGPTNRTTTGRIKALESIAVELEKSGRQKARDRVLKKIREISG